VVPFVRRCDAAVLGDVWQEWLMVEPPPSALGNDRKRGSAFG
jgi:hypothetical protein